MQARHVWIILLAVALGLGSDPVLYTTACGVWARPSSPRNTPRRRQAPAPRLRVTVTAYSHSGKTASGRRVRPGIVALSQDVERALGVAFGEPVVLEGLGTFVFDDRMSARHRRRADIFVASQQAARRFGTTVAEVRVAGARARAATSPAAWVEQHSAYCHVRMDHPEPDVWSRRGVTAGTSQEWWAQPPWNQAGESRPRGPVAAAQGAPMRALLACRPYLLANCNQNKLRLQ
jgi:3D (Asp-Asp-Asp) domain-containing protein